MMAFTSVETVPETVPDLRGAACSATSPSACATSTVTALDLVVGRFHPDEFVARITEFVARVGS